MQTTHPGQAAVTTESTESTEPTQPAEPAEERIGHDLALLDEVKTIFDMVGWFIHPDLKPMTIEEMNCVIAETWSAAR